MPNPRSFRPASTFRPVNPTLGKTPKLGPFPGDQVVPWAGICLVSYYICKTVFGLSWLWTGLAAGWGCATWWILTANGAWRWLSKFVSVPNWTRGFALYQPLLENREVNQSKTSTRQILMQMQRSRRKSFKSMRRRK